MLSMSKNSNSTGKRTSEARELSPQKRVRQAKSKLEELYATAPLPPEMSKEQHPASQAAEEMGKVRQSIGEVAVPMTLSEVCDAIGYEVRAEAFAETALASIAQEIDVLSDIAEKSCGFDGWCAFQGLAKRARLAASVQRWLESETTEVAP
jgi:hypothetical protein